MISRQSSKKTSTRIILQYKLKIFECPHFLVLKLLKNNYKSYNEAQKAYFPKEKD